MRRNGQEQGPRLRARYPVRKFESREAVGTLALPQVKDRQLRMSCVVSHISMHNNRGLLDDHLVDRVNAHLDSPTCMILSRMSVIHFCYSSGFPAMVGPLRNEDSF